MKLREAQIPLLLWVCSAIVVHVCFRTGADEVKKHVEKLESDRAGILKLLQGARGGISGPGDLSGDTELEFEPFVQELPPKDGPVAEDDTKKAAELDAPEKPKLALKPEETPKVEVAKVEPPKVEPPKPEEPKPAEEPKPKDEEKPEEKVAENEPPPMEIVPEKKISVKLSNANNIDNPDAPRLAANASKVDEEQMARDRSLDQDMPKPTSGFNPAGPKELIGHSNQDQKSGQTEEADGDPKRAPGESAKYSTDSAHEAPKPPSDMKVATNAGGPQGGGAPQPLAPQAASPGNVGGSGTPTPDSVATPTGGWSMDPARAGGSGTTGNGSGDPSKKTDFVPNVRQVGLPIPGAPPGPLQALGGQAQFEKAIGAENLRKEREAVGKKIRAEQPGRMDTNKFARWRPAIENYDPSVKLGDETALNAAASPFADYLHDIHNRLHPIFGDEFLGSGSAVGAGLEDMTLVTHVEVVLSRDEGKILRMGVIKQSGNTIFDAVALEAFDRASPYGKAPDAIVSPDGNVYLHWEFHRDPFDACSTRNAHGIMLKNAPKAKATAPAKPAKPTKKRSNDTSDGRRTPGPLLPLRKK